MGRARYVTALSALSLGVAAGPLAAQPVPRRHPEGMLMTRVRPGEDCAAVSLRVYHSPTLTNVIHRFNPTVCPGRPLLPNMELALPRWLGRRPVVSPVAFLTRLNNRVLVQTRGDTEPRAGRTNEPLFRAARVSTATQSSAELTFSNRSLVRLYESSLLVVLGDGNPRVRRAATAQDTTLVTGTLRSFLSTLAAPAPRAAPPRPVTIQTAGGQVTLRPGESQITIEPTARPTTTLAVYHGSSQLRSGAQVMPVPQGFGARAIQGQRIALPRPLPPPPGWEVRPPAILFTGPDVALVARASGGEHVDVAEWHVELARDAQFQDMIEERHVAAADDVVHVPSVSPGVFFVRVATIDRERYEGPAGAVVRTLVVTPRLEPASDAAHDTLSPPADLVCTLDGAPFTAPTVIDRTRSHVLRCATDATGADFGETTFPATQTPPPPPAPPPPAPPPPTPPPAPREGFAQRLSFRVEGQYVTTVSTPPPGVSLDHGAGASLRVGVDLRRPPIGSTGLAFGVEVFGGGAIFPQPGGARASSWPVGAALRLTPFTGRVQPWVSAGGAAVFTGQLVRPGVEAGLGLDVRLTRALLLGAVVRYTQVVETDPASLTSDARMVHAGLALTVRLPYSAGRP